MEFYDKYYDGEIRFYSARSLTESSIAYYAVEFKKTFRQGDATFVNVLADIREGRNQREIERLNPV